MVREIIKVGKNTMLVHRYNTRDDTYIEYYRPKSLNTIYKNIWAPRGNTTHYEFGSD